MYILGIDPTRIWASTDIPGYTVGQLAVDNVGRIYQFVSGNPAVDVSINNFVRISPAGVIATLSTTSSAPGTGQGHPVGLVVSLEDIPTNGWGWVQRFGAGLAQGNAATGAAANTELNTTGTAGRLDDDATAGSEVVPGVVLRLTASGNLADCFLNWPYVGRTL